MAGGPISSIRIGTRTAIVRYSTQRLLLFFDVQLDDQWRSYAELEIEHLALQEGDDEGEGEGEIKVERLYLESAISG